MSWLVHRICRHCGRTFGIQHTAGSHMPDHCPQCQHEVCDECLTAPVTLGGEG